jgi:hypothetical protein
MRILLTAALAASFAAVSLPAVAETAKPVKEKACKTLKDETACGARSDCKWSAPTDPQKKGKCAAVPKPKTT